MLSSRDDRIQGVLLGAACGDALGVPWEYNRTLTPDTPLTMSGSRLFNHAPGEWSDDTSMMIPIAQAASTHHTLTSTAARNAIASAWCNWAHTYHDVGALTRQVLTTTPAPTAEEVHSTAGVLYREGTQCAGNGSLMRTAAVALPTLTNPDITAANARYLSDLTHADPDAGDACILWTLTVAHAVNTGTFDGMDEALTYLPAHRRDLWANRLTEARATTPATFNKNGWCVHALQGAWAAIWSTNPELPGHYQRAVHAAVYGGHDTDTVAAITGALAGARNGAHTIPSHWRAAVHGWPGLTGDDLTTLALDAAQPSS